MSDPVVDIATGETYFDMDHKLQAVWLGLLWWFMSAFPQIIFRAWRPYYYYGTGVKYMTQGEWHGWINMLYSHGTIFGALGTFWLTAYIKRDSRIPQKFYYRAIAWVIPLSWVFALWIFIALIVGGTQDGGVIGRDVGFAFGYWVILAGCEALAWYLAPRAGKYYRWSEQEWWNYTKEDSPQNWPSQLADFIEY